MNQENEIAIVDIEPINVALVRKQINAIQGLMKEVMVEGTHYGVIPGCGDKPTLLKPGAEKLCMMFRLIPEFEERRRDLPNNHIEYEVKCRLRNYRGLIAGEGIGSCSSMESKYRYKNAARKCPHCHKETIIKGKDEFGGGWLCYQKKGGCGEKWPDGAKEIEAQEQGKVEHLDPIDFHNTIKKMSYKRSHVDATIRTLAASDIFAQDIEELPASHSMPDKADYGLKKIPVEIYETAAKAKEKAQIISRRIETTTAKNLESVVIDPMEGDGMPPWDTYEDEEQDTKASVEPDVIQEEQPTPLCDFGKHKGTPYSKMPALYLKWMVESKHSRIEFARDELLRRQIGGQPESYEDLAVNI